MAIYDHRVFKAHDEWWVAQVHAAVGAGVGDAGIVPDTERVFFQCRSNRKLAGRTAEIPAGWLNRISHRSMLALLDRSEEMEHSLPMRPYNAPDPKEFRQADRLTDNEGLKWAFRRIETVRVTDTGPETWPAVELICLDDSALRKEVILDDETTFGDMLTAWGQEGIQALVDAVKELYLEYQG